MSSLKAMKDCFSFILAFMQCMNLKSTNTLSTICLPRINALYYNEIKSTKQNFSLLAIVFDFISYMTL